LSRKISFFTITIKCPLLIRAGYYAIPTADTFLILNIDYTVFSLCGGPSWTNLHANGLLTMVTEYRVYKVPHSWIFSSFTY
jgi:hypothetical protein